MLESDFLDNVIGVKARKTLERVSEKYPILKSVIVPRTIVSWVDTVGKLGFEGSIPSLEGSYLSLNKSEDFGYTGALTIGDDLYTFDKADSLHVAASIGVSLGLNLDELDEGLKKTDLTKLGKSIDVLVKSYIVKKHEENNCKKLKITKSESLRQCPYCGGDYFDGDNLTFCFCTSDLKKFVKSELLIDGYLLKFSKSLDTDAIATITSAFKG